MKILFIGGNGNISWHCVQKAVSEGHEVYELNRGITRKTRRDVQVQVKQIICDMRNAKEVKEKLQGMFFDVVCDFICYNELQAQLAVEMFYSKTNQYIFVSSETVYERCKHNNPLNESAKRYDESAVSGYILGKIKAEDVFTQAYEKQNFPVTIVRPAFIYDTIISVPFGRNCFTIPQLLIEGNPLLIPGDGENIWCPLHSSDFAELFSCLIGNDKTIGEAFNIAGEQNITWNEMCEDLLYALNIQEKRVIHLHSEAIFDLDVVKDYDLFRQDMGQHLFDINKIRKFAPYWHQRISYNQGIQQTINWLNEKHDRKRIDRYFYEQMVVLYNKLELLCKGD